MSYPSQPGYPTPQYGQPQPPGQQQNNLWLIGGAVVVILIILMTVVLLIVQQTGDDSPSGDGGETGGETGGDSSYEELPPAAFESETCDQIDMAAFEEATGDSVDPESSSHSSSSYDSYDNVSCYFYTSSNYYSMNVNLYDYETLEEVLDFVEYDAEMYGEDGDYEYEEYTANGDAGSLYSLVSDPEYQTTYLHVALGSLETVVSITYNANDVDPANVKTALEDVLLQVDALFADVQ
ncbi:hypothetical protein [Glycomyces harbinensis]|uniref:DUF3558 domain-containing protein n=1 Tax=Glycomyces harbinensis TaxID=58114 RepID=A0A1G7AXD9_9ACTN|nr:hypothetical protein [Glycomyces harbinensis]SDE19548.1 hypothetical protein SAMN05216270_1153 [Glycomyces harbinensis]